MSAQKFTRKQLKQDGFVAWTERALEYVQKNYVALGIAVLVVVVVLVGSSWYRQGRQNARLEASRLLFEGQIALSGEEYGLARGKLQECIDRHGGSRFALIARVELARALHGAGESEAALATIDDALGKLSAGESLRFNALMVKATILSDLDRIPEAIAVYQDMLAAEDLPESMRLDLTLRLADCHERAGNPGEAQRVLEDLREAIVRGEVDGNARNLDSRIEFYRALAQS